MLQKENGENRQELRLVMNTITADDRTMCIGNLEVKILRVLISHN